MEKEKFDKAVELSRKMREIEEVFKEIKEPGVILSFVSREIPLRGWVFDNIKEILDRHKKEVIKEINEMYDNIKKEIEAL